MVPGPTSSPRTPSRCPCGTGETYANCCGPLHRGRGSGRVTAPTAERLMRSRYSAFAIGDDAYLLATWHETTRPTTLALDPVLEWRGLEILEVVAGGAQDDEGIVEFVARFWHPGRRERGELRERSAFRREANQWHYVGLAP